MSSQISQNELEWITEYLDGRLSEPDRQRFEQHMAADAAFKAEVDSFRELRILLKNLPQRPAPRSFALKPDMVAARPGWFGRLFPVFRFSSLAAALLLVATYAVNLLPVRMMPATAADAAPEAFSAPAAALAPEVEATVPIIIMGQSGNMPGQNYGSGGGGGGPAYGLGGGGAAPEMAFTPAADRAAEMKSGAESEMPLPTPEIFPMEPTNPAVDLSAAPPQEPTPSLLMESVPEAAGEFQPPSLLPLPDLTPQPTLGPTPEPTLPVYEMPVPTVELTPVDIPTFEPTPTETLPIAALEAEPGAAGLPGSGPILGIFAESATPAAPAVAVPEQPVQTDLSGQLREFAPGLRWILGGVLSLAMLLTFFSWRARRL